MISGLWGKKIGMTQVFDKDEVVPVTVIDSSRWFIVGLKTKERDGYSAIKVGYLKAKYDEGNVKDALKKPSQYFNYVKEIKVDEIPSDIVVGKAANFLSDFTEGIGVDVCGTSIGRGFAGTVKRYGFKGGRGSHGDKTGRRTGSVGFMRTRGRVIKGKRMPGRLGGVQKTIKNLTLINIKNDDQLLILKGSIPGKSGSLVFIKKVANE